MKGTQKNLDNIEKLNKEIDLPQEVSFGDQN